MLLSLDNLSFAESEMKTSDYSDSSGEQDLSKKASEFLKKHKYQDKSALAEQDQKIASTKQNVVSKDKIIGSKQQAVKTTKSVKIKKKSFKPVQRKPKLIKINSTNISKKQSSAAKTSKENWFLTALRKIYIRADYGVDKPQAILAEHFKKKSMYGVGIGYRFNKAFRADVNIQYRKLATKTRLLQTFGKINNSSAFLNLYLNLMDEESYVVPFLTIGVGYSRNTVKDFENSTNSSRIITERNTASSLAWNAGVGAALRLTKNFSIEAAYKYIDIGDVKMYTTVSSTGGVAQRNVTKKGTAHEISGGLVIDF